MLAFKTKSCRLLKQLEEKYGDIVQLTASMMTAICRDLTGDLSAPHTFLMDQRIQMKLDLLLACVP